MDSNEIMTNWESESQKMQNDKAYRDRVRRECLEARRVTESEEDLHIYNFIINYIGDLDWKAIREATQRK